MGGTRNTIQRTLVLDAVRSLKCHATAEEVYKSISKDHPTVSLATVYRNLNLLADAGEIRKVEVAEGPERFDHACSDHYHIRCTKCGRVFDVEMDFIANLADYVKDAHGFRFESHTIMFRGVCPECVKRDEQKANTAQNP